MNIINIPTDSSIKALVESESLTVQQKVDAIRDSVRGDNQEKIIEQLEKINNYFAIITGQKL